jgi:hypothetical protein
LDEGALELAVVEMKVVAVGGHAALPFFGVFKIVFLVEIGVYDELKFVIKMA